MRALALLSLLALLLAGCSDGGSEEPSPNAPAASATSSTAPPAPPVPRTAVLHFLAAPAMTTGALPGSDERSPVGFGDGGPDGNQAPAARWAYQVTTATNVTGGEVRIWIEIKEQMLPSIFGNPTDPPCTWRITTNVGGDSAPLVNCVNEPAGPINPGIKELAVTLVLQDPLELEVGETITVTLERTAFSASPNNAVDALSGSADHDSRIELKGLKEPITG